MKRDLRRAQAAVWTVAALIAALVVALMLRHWAVELEEQTGEAQQDIERFVQQAGAALDRSLLAADRILAAQADSVQRATRNDGSIDAQDLHQQLGIALGAHLLLRDLVLCDADGRLIGAARSAAAPPQVPSHPVADAAAQHPPALRIGPPTVDAASGERSVWLARRVGTHVVAGELPLATLASLIGPGRDQWIVTLERDDGSLLVRLSAASDPPALPGRTAAAAQQADGNAHRIAFGDGGVPALVAARPASTQAAVRIGVALPQSAIEGVSAGDRRGDVLTVAFTLVLLAGLAGLLHWHLQRQFVARSEIEAARARLAAQHDELLAQVQARERSDADRSRTQALMNSLLANTNEGFWLIDTDGRTLDVNPAMCALLGRPREQVLGRTIFDFVDDDNAAEFRRQLELRRQGRGTTYEISLQRPDGSAATCINNAAPVTDDQGRRIGSVGLWTDVSPIIAAQRELAHAKRTMDGALAAMGEGFLLFDRDDRLVRWNRRYEALFPHLVPVLRVGAPLQTLHAASARHLLPGAAPEAHAAWIAERTRHHRSGGAPLEIVQPDGLVVEVVEAAMPDGGFVATYRDVTEARRAERELREAKATLDQALDAMTDGFAVFDASERLLTWNRRYLQMFPYLDGHLERGMALDAIGEIATRAVLPDATPAQRQAFIAQRRNERLRGAGITSLTLPNGCVVEAIDRRTADGKLVSVFRDVTHSHQAARALEEARDAAEAAARTKTQFLAAISHEIRTPLNAVLGMNGLLRDSRLDAQQRRWVDLIAKSGESLLAVINDILDLSRLEAGKLHLEVVDFSPLGAVHDVVSIMSVRAEAKGLTLELQADARDALRRLHVRGDPSRLRQLLFNLIGNAIKFTEHGRVSVGLAQRDLGDGRVALSIAVRDTGIGIAPDVLPQLFEPFSQADHSISRRFGGSGLGLSICREIVQLMGGRIDVQSRPGHGSVFRVELEFDPAVPSTERVDPHFGPTQPMPPPLRGLRVLVAEDNSVNQLLIRALLDRMGHYHDVVADGVEALRQVQAAPYDVVLMDVQMPQMDGLAATRAIRALPGRAAQVPIIAMTANVLHEDRAACEAAGMSGFVGKPIERQRLAEAIERVLDEELAIDAA